eukprot:TRINITY_DN59586_c0_g1_i1.p1 TRINITY_DN59586_c0_g1~~TRINITY_DN59586_c0_g1_i1.p1  ORF type:complete len:137 (+),score=26.41 TRINITY_DN59586_c0_g1_i1:121-531(+)
MEAALVEEGAASIPVAQLSETDQFMIMLNVCAALCGSFLYWLLALRQKQNASQRERYFPGPFVSLAEASQSWKVYRPCGNKLDRDTHICNFCGFAIKALPTELSVQSGQEAQEEGKAGSDSKNLRKKLAGKKGKKS